MSTYNHNFVNNDQMFIAACGRTCADLMDSYNMDRRPALEVETGNSLGARIRHFFLGR